MEDPYEVLGIKDVTEQEKLEYLQQKYDELNANYSIFFHQKRKIKDLEDAIGGKGIRYAGLKYEIVPKTEKYTVEKALNERAIIGLPLDSMYFLADDYDIILNTIRDIHQEHGGKKGDEECRLAFNSLMDQMYRQKKEIQRLAEVIKQYTVAPKDSKAIDDLNDAFIEKKYQDLVVEIAQKMEPEIERSRNIERSNHVIEALEGSEEYRRIRDNYQKIAVAHDRHQLEPAFFEKERVWETHYYEIDKKELKRLREQEEDLEYIHDANMEVYKNARPERRYQYKIPGNQEHEIGWGIVLTDSKVLGKEKVETPQFKGNVTIKRIGYFQPSTDPKKKKIEIRGKQGHVRRKRKPTTQDKIEEIKRKVGDTLDGRKSQKTKRKRRITTRIRTI